MNPDQLIPQSEEEQSGLPVKITIIVFWGMVLVGLLTSYLLLRDLEQTIARRFDAAADSIAYHLDEYLSRHPVASEGDIARHMQEVLPRYEASGFTVQFGKRSISLGNTGDALAAEPRSVIYHPGGLAGEHLLVRVTVFHPTIADVVAAERKKILIVLGAVLLVFGFTLQRILKRVLANPFRDMTRVAKAVMAGDMNRRFDEDRTDEFGFLARFMNRALDSLARHQQEKLRHALDRAQASEDALYAEKERAVVTLHSIGDAVIATDADGLVEYLNPVAERMTGHPAAGVHGKPLETVLRLVDETSRVPLENPVRRCLRGDGAAASDHAVLLCPDGREVDVSCSAAPIRHREGQIIGAVLVFRDVGPARQMARQLSYQATHDALTGACNRRAFEDRLRLALASAEVEGHSHVLCYLDMDQFKTVNDSCGHDAGDELLRQFTSLLRRHVRETDIVARIGGDEFAILLERSGEENAVRLANDLLAGIREFHFKWQGHRFTIGASLGLVAIGPGRHEPAAVMRSADAACYAAKSAGRNRLHVYRPGDREGLRRADAH